MLEQEHAGQVVAYVRVSSVEQNPERQHAAIGPADETFTDQVSGKSRGERPALATMLRHVRAGDTVRVASMDRLARSAIDLAQIVRELTERCVRVEFVAERLEFAPGGEDPFATFQLHLLGAVAELERSMIRERQREGIAQAKARRLPGAVTQTHRWAGCRGSPAGRVGGAEGEDRPGSGMFTACVV